MWRVLSINKVEIYESWILEYKEIVDKTYKDLKIIDESSNVIYTVKIQNLKFSRCFLS